MMKLRHFAVHLDNHIFQKPENSKFSDVFFHVADVFFRLNI